MIAPTPDRMTPHESFKEYITGLLEVSETESLSCFFSKGPYLSLTQRPSTTEGVGLSESQKTKTNLTSFSIEQNAWGSSIDSITKSRIPTQLIVQVVNFNTRVSIFKISDC